jgi:hypothetical protein
MGLSSDSSISLSASTQVHCWQCEGTGTATLRESLTFIQREDHIEMVHIQGNDSPRRTRVEGRTMRELVETARARGWR